MAALAIAPAAFADHGSSQATAQSIDLKIAGNDVVVQEIRATNDGSGETVTDVSTIPPLAGVIPGNAEAFVGVAPQRAVAKPDGTSYACAGIAGTGGGLVTVGTSDCNVEAGEPLDLSLGSLDLDLENLIGGPGVITEALRENLPAELITLIQRLGLNLDNVLAQVSGGLADTPLGSIEIGGTLSVIQGYCNANPETATGDATLASVGGGATPIDLKFEGQSITILQLPVNPEPNFKPVTDLSGVGEMLVGAIRTELDEAFEGAISPLDDALEPAFLALQNQILTELETALKPLTEQVEKNILDITLNKQVPLSPAQDRIEVTALEINVLPAAAGQLGFPVVGGKIGRVTCGDNARLPHGNPPPGPGPQPGPGPGPGPGPDDIPTQVDSGMAGIDTTAILLGTGALMLAAGVTGIAGYRRMLEQ